MNIPIPPIREFPHDGRLWRIDWLGPVRGNPGSSSEPTIDVILSPVRDKRPNPYTTYDVHNEERLASQIGIGQLPLLRICSLWKNGRLLDTAAGKRFTLQNINISKDTVSEILTSNKNNDGSWTIPASVHSVTKSGLAQGFDTHCLTIAYGDDPFGIIIPVPEVIRFYYACSTYLSHAAFSGTYQHNIASIIDLDKSGFLAENNKRLVIRLRRWLYDDDAWTIGRLIADPVARTGARMIHDSLLKATASGNIAYPRSTFPFVGRVNWTFRGLSFKHNDSERYLVLELLRCSSPFPYEELEVTRDNDGRTPEYNAVPDEERKPSWVGPRNVHLDKAKAELQSQEDPQAGTKPYKIALATDRFDALDGKAILRDPKTESKYKAAELTFLPAHIANQLGTGQGTYADNTTAQANVLASHVKKPTLPASLERIDDIAAELNKYDDVAATVIPSHGEEIVLPLFSPSGRAQWPYLDSHERTRRRVRAIQICYRDMEYFFVEFEQRKDEKKTAGIFWSALSSTISQLDFYHALWTLSETSGIWNRSDFLRSGIQCRKMKHTWPSTSACAASIYNVIKNIIK